MSDFIVTPATKPVFNIAGHLPRVAAERPYQPAVVFPASRDGSGRTSYVHWTFQQLDRESDRFAAALTKAGIGRGTRTLLMVPPGLEFIGLTFALFKTGSIPVLIDPGMARGSLLQCLREVEPEAMVAVPLAHWMRFLFRQHFPRLTKRVCVGRYRHTGAPTLSELLPSDPKPFPQAETSTDETAAIIFTTGSTGIPKGVVYEHGMFGAQVDHLRDYYRIEPGEVDVAGFPLFALFNAPMGVTTVIPDMDPRRPANVDPAKFVEAIEDFGATQSFGSPAIWQRVSRYCISREQRLPSLRRILMAGAPVPPDLLERTQAILVGSGKAYTPYGATEALPVASIDSLEVIERTAEKTRDANGTCVGKPFPNITLRIIRTSDEPIETWSEDLIVPDGTIGEIVVKGPVVTKTYDHRPGSTKLAKIADGDEVWHRMGDLGYLDEEGRLWFCGRKAHRVETLHGTLHTVRCEAVFNNHPSVRRSALVGIGSPPKQEPIIVIEPIKGAFPKNSVAIERFRGELLAFGTDHDQTRAIRRFLFHRSFPVDIRHNAKIFREKLALWADKQLRERS
ncbi:Long-chain-fatty-acid--CoA ligase [Planctomycetes bacterium Pan216]|uniref:Long-chain-fatty-acid--CoA ligase n=1 Tax=Kolteria novifilia TaxID=2527975 RepID=A0A518B9S7_9BACT|nr:Long-chain-fatty-acid--CoA ligase [Planctomycetes bacterium Pan216]